MRHESPLRFRAIVALTLLAGCPKNEDNSLYVFGAYDETADFSSFQTYDVVQPDDVPDDQKAPKAYVAANRKAVIESIMDEMEDRGYVRDPSDPDLLVSPLVRHQDVEVTVVTPYYWYDYYYGAYWGYAYTWYDIDIVKLDAGTLIIDAVAVGDPEETDDDKLVFRGYATAILPEEPADISAKLPEVVARIFNFWPDSE